MREKRNRYGRKKEKIKASRDIAVFQKAKRTETKETEMEESEKKKKASHDDIAVHLKTKKNRERKTEMKERN